MEYSRNTLEFFDLPKSEYMEIMYHEQCYPYEFYKSLTQDYRLLYGCKEQTRDDENELTGTYHYHFIAKLTDQEARKLRTIFAKKRIARCLYGNASSILRIKYGLKEKLEYINKAEAHGHRPIIVLNNIGITSEDKFLLHEDFYKRKEDLQQPSSTTKKQSSINTLLEIESYVQTKMDDQVSDGYTDCWTINRIGPHIVSYYRINNKVFNKFYMLNLAITLVARHNAEKDPGSDESIWQHLINDRNLY